MDLLPSLPCLPTLPLLARERATLPSSSDVSDGVINNFKQGSMNDCFVLSGINAFAHTDLGSSAIKNDIKDNHDGTFTVSFSGDKNHKSYTVTQDDIKKDYASSDVDVNILAAGLEKYVNDPLNKDTAKQFIGSGMMKPGDPDSDKIDFEHGGDSQYIMKILGGDQVKSDKALSAKDGKQAIQDFLTAQAPKIGKGSALVLSGNADKATGNWTPCKDISLAHQFAIGKIDLNEDAGDGGSGGTVYYTNPWDTSIVHKISVSKLAEDLTTADPSVDSLQEVNFT